MSHLVDISDLDNLARAMAAVAETLACDRVELSYLDATGSYLEAVRPEAWQPEGVRYYLDEYLPTKRSLESQEIFQILVDDPDADAREVQWMQTEGLRTLIGVPIVCAGQAIGLLECCKVDSTPWSRSQLSRARMVTTVLGPVLGALQDRAR